MMMMMMMTTTRTMKKMMMMKLLILVVEEVGVGVEGVLSSYHPYLLAPNLENGQRGSA
jgi:hypothetical protein